MRSQPDAFAASWRIHNYDTALVCIMASKLCQKCSSLSAEHLGWWQRWPFCVHVILAEVFIIKRRTARVVTKTTLPCIRNWCIDIVNMFVCNGHNISENLYHTEIILSPLKPNTGNQVTPGFCEISYKLKCKNTANSQPAYSNATKEQNQGKWSNCLNNFTRIRP